MTGAEFDEKFRREQEEEYERMRKFHMDDGEVRKIITEEDWIPQDYNYWRDKHSTEPESEVQRFLDEELLYFFINDFDVQYDPKENVFHVRSDWEWCPYGRGESLKEAIGMILPYIMNHFLGQFFDKIEKEFKDFYEENKKE